MNETPEERAASEFAKWRARDLEEGVERPLDEYVARFPEISERIARELQEETTRKGSACVPDTGAESRQTRL